MLAFKVDENLPSQATKLLCREGYDAVSVLDQRLGGAGDATVASVCKNEGRILITWIQASLSSQPLAYCLWIVSETKVRVKR